MFHQDEGQGHPQSQSWEMMEQSYMAETLIWGCSRWLHTMDSKFMDIYSWIFTFVAMKKRIAK